VGVSRSSVRTKCRAGKKELKSLEESKIVWGLSLRGRPRLGVSGVGPDKKPAQGSSGRVEVGVRKKKGPAVELARKVSRLGSRTKTRKNFEASSKKGIESRATRASEVLSILIKEPSLDRLKLDRGKGAGGPQIHAIKGGSTIGQRGSGSGRQLLRRSGGVPETPGKKIGLTRPTLQGTDQGKGEGQVISKSPVVGHSPLKGGGSSEGRKSRGLPCQGGEGVRTRAPSGRLKGNGGTHTSIRPPLTHQPFLGFQGG